MRQHRHIELTQDTLNSLLEELEEMEMTISEAITLIIETAEEMMISLENEGFEE